MGDGNPPNPDPLGAGTFTYDLRFPGQIAGTWGSTFQNGYRDYDPAVGRYGESDPVGLLGGSYSTYAYVSDDPISYIDALGLCPGDRKTCEHDYLEQYYGSWVADHLVPSFSLGSYVPGSGYFANAWESFAEAVAIKGGIVGSLGLLSNYFSNLSWSTLASPIPEGPFGLQVRAWSAAQAASRAAAADTAAAVGAGTLAVVGTLGTSFATTADFLAYLHCRNEQP